MDCFEIVSTARRDSNLPSGFSGYYPLTYKYMPYYFIGGRLGVMCC